MIRTKKILFIIGVMIITAVFTATLIKTDIIAALISTVIVALVYIILVGNTMNVYSFIKTKHKAFEKSRYQKEIDKLLEPLSDKQRKAIVKRFGLYGGEPCSYANIAKKLECSREKARAICTKALANISQTEESMRQLAEKGRHKYDTYETVYGQND